MLSFGHAGILYENSFVMYDRKTGSLWVHVTGRRMKGKQLKFFPSTVTTWAQWRATYPHTLVLPGCRTEGFMGTYRGASQPVDLGLSVVVRFRGKLYPFPILADAPVVNDHFNGAALLVHYSKRHGTAVAWSRKLGGRELTFEEAGRDGPGGVVLLRDRETGSLWSSLKGEAVEGRLRGAHLEVVSHNPILMDRFRAFYPDGPIFHR